ncbi:hypothetical protein NE237_028846 [Protea cynaroides]|uniref:non-specific serine/threonine protein kinase n=1 Tax=Protea cynaroides TaxID=273540 RepID=A0A9Q0GUM7_9MAGN|nr:hypothetical protein NE237_028846 [Protea cynaroides]
MGSLGKYQEAGKFGLNLWYFSLYQNSLSGEIPEFLFRLPNLETVYLHKNGFNGSIPSNVGNATELLYLWLYGNQLSGTVPPTIGNCTKLEDLYLTENHLVGVLPESLNNLENLVNLDVGKNSLHGRIPLGLGRCKRLSVLVLSYNQFTGEIPSGLGNCSGLMTFAAVNDGLTGHIPSSLGLLTELRILYLSQNHLSGKIPPELGNCKSLEELFLKENQLEGEIPRELGMLKSLKQLHLYTNHLIGEIPTSIWRIPTLEVFHVYNNNLSGELPLEMTELQNLRNVSLFNNKLSGAIPSTFGINCSLLEVDFTNNLFSGEIPPNLCFGKQLQMLIMGFNLLHGSIPADVGSCPTLSRLILKENNLTGSLPHFVENPNLLYIDISGNNINGTIPSSLGNCTNLTSVDLSRNKLTGSIPHDLGNLVDLQHLNLSYNQLQGPFPPDISNCVKLFYLNVGSNSLNGSIPQSMRNLTELRNLILGENWFTGGIPDFLSDFDELLELQIGGNLLGGNIPPSIGELHSLDTALNLSDNGLTGQIPSEMGKLIMLQRLDISYNNLTGSLATLNLLQSLTEVNVSHNNFTGTIPDALMKLLSSSPSSFLGNSGLCVRCLGSAATCGLNILSPCHPNQSTDCKKGLSTVNIAIISLGSSLFCVLMILLLSYVLYRCRRESLDIAISVCEGSSQLLSKVMEATDNLNERFIIGRGAHGTVYKVLLAPEKLCAVKKFTFAGQKGAHASMIREIQTIGKIKHRNLVKFEEFWLRKNYGLILYQYLENGSLHDVLHELNPAPILRWDVRYKIALGTAQGLAYLHDDCNPPIVHRDIKPNNILLDSDMEPHISDFGIAKLMDHSSTSNLSATIAGTIGYLAPETAYATGKSKEADVYSYGVVLLELVTRKKVMEMSFPEGMDLVSWVHSTRINTESIHGIVEPSLMEEFVDSTVMDEVINVLLLALKCTEKQPRERPPIKDVVKQLIGAKARIRGKIKHYNSDLQSEKNPPTFFPALSLLVFLVYLVTYGETVDAQINMTAAKVIDVGVILDLDTLVGKMCYSCISMAVSDFYAKHNNYTTRLLLHTRNSEGDIVEAASTGINLLKNVGVQAILGPQKSGQAQFLVNLGNKSQVPIISFTATSPTVSSTETPYFIRTALNDSSQVKAIAATIQTFGWREVVLIYEDTEYGRGIIPSIIDAFQEKYVHVPYRSVISPRVADDQVLSELYKLMIKQTRVFVVHMSSSLGSRFFLKAKEIGMMSKGYAWIITDGLTGLLDSMDQLVIDSMQGVLGVKPYVPRSKELNNFTTRWKMKIRQENLNIDRMDLSIFGLWAYDSVWALAMAAERVHVFQLESQKLMGSELLKALMNVRFEGLSGKFRIVDGQLLSSAFQIVNVIGKGERHIGFWTPTYGISENLYPSDKKVYSASMDDLRHVIWPGESTEVPKGWVIPTSGKKLRIGVPVKDGFSEFVKIERDPHTKGLIVTGYCIDVFKVVMDSLPYGVSYEFFPFEKADGHSAGSYNDLVQQVYLQNYDAVVGDTTILANRSFFVDFTMPYTESGVAMVVPIRGNRQKNAWVFLKPLQMDLWLTTGAFFVITGFVVWVIEHRINREFRGPPAEQVGIIFWFSFSTLVFAHKEKIMSNLSRFVVIIWIFVVLVLTSSYTASLTSMLTVEQLQPTITDIKDLRRNGDYVGYQDGSFVTAIMKSLDFDESKLRNYSTLEKYDQALSRGGQNGGVAAIVDEIPYIRLFLAKYCSKYTMIGPIYRTAGFGFVFPKDSPLVPDVSRAVLNLQEGDKMTAIEREWFGKQTECPEQGGTRVTSGSLNLDSFKGPFLIAGVSSTTALLIFFCKFFHEHWHILTSEDSVRNKLASMAKHFDQLKDV